MRSGSVAILQRLDARARWLIAVLLLLGLALARPTVPWQRNIYNAIFVIDISQSMNTRDYQLAEHTVSRLQAVKHTLSNSLGQIPCGSEGRLGDFHRVSTLLASGAGRRLCELRRVIRPASSIVSGRDGLGRGSEIGKGS